MIELASSLVFKVIFSLYKNLSDTLTINEFYASP